MNLEKRVSMLAKAMIEGSELSGEHIISDAKELLLQPMLDFLHDFTLKHFEIIEITETYHGKCLIPKIKIADEYLFELEMEYKPCVDDSRYIYFNNVNLKSFHPIEKDLTKGAIENYINYLIAEEINISEIYHLERELIPLLKKGGYKSLDQTEFYEDTADVFEDNKNSKVYSIVYITFKTDNDDIKVKVLINKKQSHVIGYKFI